MNDPQRRYLRRFILGMVGYIILLPASLLLIRGERLDNTTVAVVIGLSPMIPFLYAMSAVVGNVRQQDELQRRIHLEAVLITALLTGSLTFSYGLLEAAELVPDLPMTVVAPFMIIVWGLANALISRRYR
jgi:hypothetical protein